MIFVVGSRHLEKKWINCYISATFRPISTKFCTLTHIGPPNPKECSKNQFLTNPRWRTATILKIEKLRCLQKRLADFAEI